jgi:hypothetical protein
VRDLGRAASYEVSALPGPLLGQERYLFGHPVPQVLNRWRLAGPPDPGEAAPLGFALVRNAARSAVDVTGIRSHVTNDTNEPKVTIGTASPITRTGEDAHSPP